MKIAIIGAGNVGAALAQAFRRCGHEIVFGVKSPDSEKPDQLAIVEAANSAEVSILAVPFEAVPEVVESASGFVDKVVIDATNPLRVGEGGLGAPVVGIRHISSSLLSCPFGSVSGGQARSREDQG